MAKHLRIRRNDAAAIRHGIEYGKTAGESYGTDEDRFYTLRSKLLSDFYMQTELRKLAVAAFTRTWKRVAADRAEKMTVAQRREAEAAHERAHLEHTETRDQRERRLLREEVANMRTELAELKKNQGHSDAS